MLSSPGGPLLDTPRSRLPKLSSSRGTLPKNPSSRPSLTAQSGSLASNPTPSLSRYLKLSAEESSRLSRMPPSSLKRAGQLSTKDLPTSLLSCKTLTGLPGTTETFTGPLLLIGKPLRMLRMILANVMLKLPSNSGVRLNLLLNTSRRPTPLTGGAP